ncbi:hypothetical protein O6H91_06G085100 [Diphasiastrum complanatum]|uniref:Uncharacterized protein n=2 Tax=Diphasiastrum complanatum TaxID=34168 RepID=A0ACC2DGB3_DIPCM|nr:hypothetical protein O6H91_06G085100 [Diphasiastrum complanatum]KAJ7553132.1 hypothetical protein O6H91_06G085100 [Diphasiastrum complanatum]
MAAANEGSDHRCQEKDAQHSSCGKINSPTNKVKNPIAPVDIVPCKTTQITEFVRSRGGWRSTPFIFGIATCDLLCSLGLQVNLISYLVSRLNLSLAEASNTVTNFSGMCCFAPLLGAILADAYVGRYSMILFGSLAYTLGLSLLTLEATIHSWIRPPCPPADLKNLPAPHSGCKQASKSRQMGYLYLAFIFIAMGAGGVRPSVAAFGADQFDIKDPVERTQLWKFFNCPFTRLVQVVVAAFRKRHLILPSDPATLYQSSGAEPKVKGVITLTHTNQFRFLDKAAIVVTESENIDAERGNPERVLLSFNPWKLCGVHQVEELKSLLRMVPIWTSGMLVFTAWVQQNTLWIQQARSMDRAIGRFQIPPASFSIFSSLTLISWVPIYDRCVLPLARRLTGHERGITFLQRIGTGGFICILAMLLAGFVEIKRRHAAFSGGLIDQPNAIVPLSAFWLVPQYCLIGLSESFVSIGYLEFFYDQSPQSMRSMATAILWAIVGAGSYLSTLLVSTVNKLTRAGSAEGGWLSTNLNRGHLEYFYWLLAAILTANFVVYQILVAHYTYTKIDVDQADERSLPIMH